MLAAFDSHLSTRITSMNRSAAVITSPCVVDPLVIAIVASLVACSPMATKVLSAAGSPAAPAPDGVFFYFQVATPPPCCRCRACRAVVYSTAARHARNPVLAGSPSRPRYRRHGETPGDVWLHSLASE